MKDVLSAGLQDFIKELVPEPDPLLKEMIGYAQENHISIVEPEVGHLLNMMVHLIKAKDILEIGTAIGYSTISMARALGDDGQITTIEILERRGNVAKENFIKAGVSGKIQSIIGDARVIVPDLAQSYDLIFLDAAKGQYGEFLNIAQRILKPNGLIIADNVFINGWVIDLKYPDRRKKTMVYWMKGFLEDLKTDPNYQCSVLPLGDGVALIWKRGD